MIGMILGNRYELIKEIGSGGMANVYLAHCRLLNRSVAVKILKSEFVNDKEFLERFNKEAQVAATISSPNIVNVYDVGHDGDIHYIVMEYVEGHTLKEYIDANGMLSWQETVEYAIQICSALDRAHKNGIVHRDIKPQNIILTNDGVLKVTDFGIARASSNETTNMGESTMGSVHYFSPEQARGGYTDAKSDIYSLGIVMYELITGILPFNGESPIAIAIKHMQEKPVSPKEFNVSIPLAVESIILKAMSKEQSLRYQSAEEMLADLNGVMQKPSDFVLNTAVSYGDTIKMEPVTADAKTEPEKEKNVQHRPVNADKRKKKKSEKTKNPAEKGTKTAVALAVISSFAVIALAMGIVVWGVLLGGFSSCSSKKLEVPDLLGMNYKVAMEKYDKENGGDFIIELIEEQSDEPEGTILSQSPEAGKEVKGNLTITIYVAMPFDSFIMPDYSGMTEKEFEKDFKQYEEKYDVDYEIKYEANLQIEKGTVIRTEPDGDEPVEKGETVTIYVSAGGFAMEDLTGLTLKDAKEALSKLGLRLGNVDPWQAEEHFVVMGQFVTGEDGVQKPIMQGDAVAAGTAIDFSVTKVDKPVNTKTVTLRVPQDKESTLIRVLQDGEQIHNRRHEKSEGYVDVIISGLGEVKVEVYFDGVLESSFTENL